MKTDKESNTANASMDDDTMLATVHTPVAIEAFKPKLTKGESALLKLMESCISENRVMMKSECVDLYKNNVCNGGGKLVRNYNSTSKEWTHSLRDTTEGEYRTLAFQWLRSALGNLILKAKLVAIPVIEV